MALGSRPITVAEGLYDPSGLHGATDQSLPWLCHLQDAVLANRPLEVSDELSQFPQAAGRRK